MKSSSKLGAHRKQSECEHRDAIGLWHNHGQIWSKKTGALQRCRSAVREDKRGGCQLSRDARAGIAYVLIHCIRVKPERVGSAVRAAPNCC